MDILVGGHLISIECSGGVFYLSGEFAGNIDFSVKFSEPVATDKALANLRARIPGRQELVDVAGYQETPDGLEVTVYSELAPPGEDIPESAAPRRVEVLWLEHSPDHPIETMFVKLAR